MPIIFIWNQMMKNLFSHLNSIFHRKLRKISYILPKMSFCLPHNFKQNYYCILLGAIHIGHKPYRLHVYTILATGQTLSAKSISVTDKIGYILIGHFVTWKNVKFGHIADDINQIKIGHKQIRPYPYRSNFFFNLEKCKNWSHIRIKYGYTKKSILCM